MNNAQIYCTTTELAYDLGIDDNPGDLLPRIRAASAFLQRRLGEMIPVTEARAFGVQGAGDIQVDPLLAVTTLVNGTSTIAAADYTLYPPNRYWTNGCYTRIHSDYVAWDDDDIVITGRWGKYEETESLGTSGSLVDASTTLLLVGDGKPLAAGMIVLMGTEQMLVTDYGGFTSGSAPTYSGSAVSVANYYQVQRGVNGTTAAAHGASIISRYVVPYDVNFLCREMAGLKYMIAKSAFSGRTGNEATGIEYYHEHPKAIEEVVRNYRITRI